MTGWGCSPALGTGGKDEHVGMAPQGPSQLDKATVKCPKAEKSPLGGTQVQQGFSKYRSWPGPQDTLG